MIGIIGDTHFGAGYNMGKTDPSTQLNTRLLDFKKTFNYIIDGFVSLGVKLVVLTGDIFETRHPTASQHKVFSQCIQRAIDFGLEIVIVVGNHDQQRHVDTTTVDIYNSLKIPGVKVFQNMGIHSLNDNTHLILMPYRDRRMVGGETNRDAINIIKENFNTLTQNLPGSKIVVGHFMMEKDDDMLDPDMFSMNELILPIDMFEKCDTVVMGHIHKHEILSKKSPTCIYSGSMDKVSFGEKAHKKVSLVIDPENPTDVKIIPTKVRNLYELEFDYSDEEPLKNEINNRVIQNINEYTDTTDIKNSICKIMLTVKDIDLYYLNPSLFKSHILSKGIQYCTGVHVNSTNNRQLRNSAINETLSGSKAIAEFINSLRESDEHKKRLLKYAEQVIEEVESK